MNKKNIFLYFFLKFKKKYLFNNICILNNDVKFIYIKGKKKINFINNNITNNIKYTNNNFIITSLCNKYGKLLSIFLIIKNKNNIILNIPNNIYLYILFFFKKKYFKKKIIIKNNNSIININLTGKNIKNILNIFFSKIINMKIYNKIINLNGFLIRFPNNYNKYYYQWITNINNLNKLYFYFKKKIYFYNINFWNILEININKYYLNKNIIKKFIPQIFNLDLKKIIKFNKGCYLGQEIITKIQNLKRIKYRIFLGIIYIKNIKNIFFIFNEQNIKNKIINFAKIKKKKYFFIFFFKKKYFKKKIFFYFKKKIKIKIFNLI